LETTEDQIKTVIDAVLSGFEQGTIQGNHEALIKLKKLHDQNPELFLDNVEMALHNFNTLVHAVIETKDQKNEYILQFITNGLYEHFHRIRIEKLEGFACCADKSSFIKSMTLKAVKENQNFSLFNDYSHVERITENKDSQAYWSPKTIQDTDEAIKLFWNWYNLKDQE
jgi:hypothetical protein